MAIGSTTANKGVCELFMAELDKLVEDLAEAWTEISSTTAGRPKGVTADMLSKIWTIFGWSSLPSHVIWSKSWIAYPP